MDKRPQLIDRLLARDEFVDYWTHKFSHLLLVSGRRLRPEPVKAYYQWIRGHIANNTPRDIRWFAKFSRPRAAAWRTERRTSLRYIKIPRE